MKIFTHRIQFLILALYVPVVILLFKLIDDRVLASTLAGVGFVIWPILYVAIEFNQRKTAPISKVHVVGCLQFLVLAALPILILRLYYWGLPFNELSLLGINAMSLHKFSNVSYLVMVIAVAYSNYEDRKNKNR